MRTHQGRITAVQIDEQGRQGIWIACPTAARPAPGQYLSAYAPQDSDAPLAMTLFLGETQEEEAKQTHTPFLALPAAPMPAAWLPGTELSLRGPLGNGFRLPANLRRLALAALGDTSARLLPLARQALAQGTDIALFTDYVPAALPSSLEVQPLAALPEVLGWAETLALDLPLSALPDLRRRLHIDRDYRLAFPAQALVLADMPCAALAACGACAVPARRGWKLACADGPVFDLEELEW